MLPDPRFTNAPDPFWAIVRSVGDHLGYTVRGAGLTRHTADAIGAYLTGKGLLVPSNIIEAVAAYIAVRADLLERVVEPALMNKAEAAAEYTRLLESGLWQSYQPKNKQKGEMAGANYLNAMVNILAERTLGGHFFASRPDHLIHLLTPDGLPVVVLPRQMDGAYPDLTNPAAVWEVKEYYSTTTFGSRVADGVYETRLDGQELRRARLDHGILVANYLIVDDHFTWWEKGKSYLCRILDMLHEGLITEAVFGRQVFSDWPRIVASWPPPSEVA